MNAILVINSGSSSIKLQLIKMPGETVVASGLIERIGQESSALHLTTKKGKISEEISIPDHEAGLTEFTKLLMDKENGVIKDASEIIAVGHRVVHGGIKFTDTTVVDEEVKQAIRDLFDLAPLHNPPNLKGIEVAEKIFPNAKQVAVFDTAFHQTIPTKAKRYAIPDEFSDEHQLQVFGFHGISHKYVSQKTFEFLKKPKGKIITVHLGNGCSITAVKDGKSFDHSLGFAPVNGLIMGTRSGDIDHSVILYMIDKLGYTTEEVNEILHKKSGMQGLTGFSDLRDIEAEAEKGNEKCQLALEMNAYRIKKYIGAYIAAMNGVDAIVFTAGIGENSDVLRELVCRDMEYLGIELEGYKNDIRSKEPRVISKEGARVSVLVIPTNEELEIAKETAELVL
ncbi:acetate/propionate family kinase [Robertkochia sediminum]|uniref:acetate/propionate family kinase n=1 Tax=Robertkochia sediminum TaxID=2785326 RepID=UPI0019333A80|nr:acetate kinase [Robertkochia sediminum]MBL7473427.1 acetate kinase [Robertkochia sediminum]